MLVFMPKEHYNKLLAEIEQLKAEVENMKHDSVNSPGHYTAGGIETIDYIKAKLTPEQFEGYMLGNVIKYTSRFQLKNGAEDLNKANWYLERLRDLPAKSLELAEAALTKSISDLCKEAYQNAVNKGWYEEPRTFGDAIALMHSELSEALEDYRAGKGFNEVWYEDDKPCGIPTELADVVIRVFDLCGYLDIGLEAAIMEKMAYNSTRPKRHGGKKL